MADYLPAATQLFIDPATATLADAGLRADQVDTIVTVSSTGIATQRLRRKLPLRSGFVPMFPACRCSTLAVQAASQDCRSRAGLPWQSQIRQSCWSRLSHAAYHSAPTVCKKRTSLPRFCSATPRQRMFCLQAAARSLWSPDKSICGPTHRP